MWKGYNHLAILEFEGEVPKVLLSLKPHFESKRWDPRYIICRKEDVHRCQKQLKAAKEEHDEFIRIHNPELYAADGKEDIKAGLG